MLRRSHFLLDKTHNPTKVYKHGYVPDPRKFAAVEIPNYHELFPRITRPPCKAVPDTDTFLEKTDIDERVPMADFKSSFQSWDELMTSRPKQNQKVRGMSKKATMWLSENIDNYRNGRLPDYFDNKNEQTYFKQFTLRKCNYLYRIPDLPEKYRPHQLGEEANSAIHKSASKFREQNRMPEWAVKEEDRLIEKGVMKKR